jgi:hypothetical protein
VKTTPIAEASAFLHNSSKKAKASPSQEEIGMKAYEIWLAQGQGPGRDQEHWFEAERQFRDA